MEFTLDRIKDGVAVLIDGNSKIYECDPTLLPKDSHEGDVFVSQKCPGTAGFLPERAPRIKEEHARRINGLFVKLKNKNTDI